MQALGPQPQTGLALNRVKGRNTAKSAAPRVGAIVSELDSLRPPITRSADPHTRRGAHSCGHNAQIAGMLGAAMGLNSHSARQPPRPAKSSFSVREEFIDVEERLGRRDKGALDSPPRQARAPAKAISTISTWR